MRSMLPVLLVIAGACPREYREIPIGSMDRKYVARSTQLLGWCLDPGDRGCLEWLVKLIPSVW